MKGIYPLPMEGGCPKGRGLAEGEMRAKPTSGAMRHLLPEEGGRSGMKGIYPLPMEGGCPKGRGLAEDERERSQSPALLPPFSERREKSFSPL